MSLKAIFEAIVKALTTEKKPEVKHPKKSPEMPISGDF